MAPDAVPVLRELSGPELAGGIAPDGTITLVFDGLRLPIALPPLAPAILRLVDGRRSVGEIAADAGSNAAPAPRRSSAPGARRSARWRRSTVCCSRRRLAKEAAGI